MTEPESTVEWGVRVEDARLDGFTSAVTSEAHADRLIAQAHYGAGTVITKLRRQVGEWEEVSATGADQ